MSNSWIPVSHLRAKVKMVAAIAALVCLVLGSACRQRSKSEASAVSNSPDIDIPQDTVPDPVRFQFVYGDSVNRSFFWDGESNLDETTDGTLRVDGLTVLYIEQATVPFALRTSLMDIEVLELPILLKIDAFDREAGQSLELFSGALKVEKAYESSFPSLDTLRSGDLYMINKDIDLSEKERLDDFTTLEWWESYRELHRSH